MAKRTKTAAGKKKGPKTSNDALNMAAIHWLALESEQTAVDVYVTYPERVPQIVASLRAQVTTVRGIGKGGMTLGSDDCPEGWVECDGLCVPMCTN